MSEFAPVVTLQDYATLHNAEIGQGYADGYMGVPESHDTASRSYQHGWKNGATDAGYRDMDADQEKLLDTAISRGTA